MSTEIKVPNLPESVSEATVSQWQVKPGDAVKRDQNLVDLETDKVVLEVPAIADGVITEIRTSEGDIVGSGDVLAVLEEGATADAAPAAEDEPKKEAKPAAKEPEKQEEPAAEPSGPASPAAQKILDDHKLSANDITGTGKDGRITKADALAAVESNATKQEQKAAAKSAASEAAQPAPALDSTADDLEDDDHAQVDLEALGKARSDRPERRVPMTRIRARIAERLLDVSQNTAMLTTFNEVDVQQIKYLRSRYKEQFQKSHDVRLGYMSFFVKAAVEALKRFPVVNASIDQDDVVYHGYYDIGMAVSSPRGLLVPVIRDADQLSYAEIESTIHDFGVRANDGKITLDELTGGTFTITNGGVFGSMLSTPIINPPQAAILGMHAITDRPVVRDGEIVIRPIMMLALSYDHRLIDGRDAVLFLRTIKELIEDPSRLLLQL